MPGKLLIAGASGLVGRAVLAHAERDSEHELVAIARRRPDFPSRAEFLSVDLRDQADCAAKLKHVTGVTHAVYAALFEPTPGREGWVMAENIAGNLAMLHNFLDAVESYNPSLRHIALLQGTKAYGSHLGPFVIPGKESAPRHPHPNFYWAQEDLLRERQLSAPWTWTIFRPQIVLGFSPASPLNLIAAIGAYAAISRELGLPLVFPGNGGWITEATDSRLLARAIAWAGNTEQACNEIFNITNGDPLVFRNVWPAIARCFGMECGLSQPAALDVIMADKEPVWDTVVRRYGLRPFSLRELVGDSFKFVDDLFSRSYSASLVSTIKVRQAGFGDCIDTEDSIVEWIIALQRERILPK